MGAKAKRAKAERKLEKLARQAGVALAYYESAKTTKSRKARRERGSADAAIVRAGTSIREQARHLEQNHDLARGALATLVQNIVGAHGIGIEPQPRTVGGELLEDLASDILHLLRDWSRRPEVTWTHDWASVQRILCRSWLRDGEALAQHLEGTVPFLDHGTYVPYSLEMMEADLLPVDFHGQKITSGVERNAWGRAVAFHLYRRHPGDVTNYASGFGIGNELKRVPAERIMHLKLVDRIRQARGVSVFASVMSRFDDIKEIEESERIAAKVAASMAAAIIKGAPENYQQTGFADPQTGELEPRDLKFRPGMIFDDLLPGESIETIDTKRPNPNVGPFRLDQMRAASSGLGCTASSLSKNYDGSYSAQRQELVEGFGAYSLMSAEFTSQCVRPVYEHFLAVAVASGQLSLPADLDLRTLDDAIYIFPQMPWIDPGKEANAWLQLERAGHASGPEIVRRRGLNPRDVMEQERNWRRQWRDKGEMIEADPANDSGTPLQDTGDTNNADSTSARTRTR